MRPSVEAMRFVRILHGCVWGWRREAPRRASLALLNPTFPHADCLIPGCTLGSRPCLLWSGGQSAQARTKRHADGRVSPLGRAYHREAGGLLTVECKYIRPMDRRAWAKRLLCPALLQPRRLSLLKRELAERGRFSASGQRGRVAAWQRQSNLALQRSGVHRSVSNGPGAKRPGPPLCRKVRVRTEGRRCARKTAAGSIWLSGFLR